MPRQTYDGIAVAVLLCTTAAWAQPAPAAAQLAPGQTCTLLTQANADASAQARPTCNTTDRRREYRPPTSRLGSKASRAGAARSARPPGRTAIKPLTRSRS